MYVRHNINTLLFVNRYDGNVNFKHGLGAPTRMSTPEAPTTLIRPWSQRSNTLEKQSLPRTLEWPAKSPDLNPKDVWMVLKNAISKRCPPPKTLSDLQAVIREECEKIPIEQQNVDRSTY